MRFAAARNEPRPYNMCFLPTFPLRTWKMQRKRRIHGSVLFNRLTGQLDFNTTWQEAGIII